MGKFNTNLMDMPRRYIVIQLEVIQFYNGNRFPTFLRNIGAGDLYFW